MTDFFNFGLTYYATYISEDALQVISTVVFNLTSK